MSILLGLEPFQKLAVGGWWVGGWSKGILEFRFGPNLGLGPWSLDQAEQKLSKSAGIDQNQYEKVQNMSWNVQNLPLNVQISPKMYKVS